MMSSWTVSSQITGISREQKIEVVSTLIAYPLVLEELSLTNELLSECNEINRIQSERIGFYMDNEVLYKGQVKVLEDQIELYKKQLIRQKAKQGFIISAGVVGIIGAFLIN